MSIRLVGPSLAGVRPRSGWKRWAFLLFFFHAACVTGVPREVLSGEAAREHVEAESVQLSLPTPFGAVQVSDSELNEALTPLVLSMPLEVAGSRLLSTSTVNWRWLPHAPTGAWRTPLARSYGRLCEWQGTPGDCLELFKDGPGLDDKDKRDIALALAVSAALEARDSELRAMFSTAQLWTTLSLTLTGYMALLVAPEPVSKGVATALTVLLWGYLGWEFFDLIRAYFQLWEEAAEASSLTELREAGDALWEGHRAQQRAHPGHAGHGGSGRDIGARLQRFEVTRVHASRGLT